MMAGAVLLSGGAVAGERDEVTRLIRQVSYLSEALAASKAEADVLRAQVDARASVGAGDRGVILPGVALSEKEYRVLDVNKELGMVILNGGKQDGVKAGMQFAVIEQGRAVAQVRIVDVRAAVAGAVVQEGRWEYPRVLDRAVLATGSRN